MFTLLDSIICPMIDFIGLMSCKTSKWISLAICALILLLIVRKLFSY